MILSSLIALLTHFGTASCARAQDAGVMRRLSAEEPIALPASDGAMSVTRVELIPTRPQPTSAIAEDVRAAGPAEDRS